MIYNFLDIVPLAPAQSRHSLSRFTRRFVYILGRNCFTAFPRVRDDGMGGQIAESQPTPVTTQ